MLPVDAQHDYNSLNPLYPDLETSLPTQIYGLAMQSFGLLSVIYTGLKLSSHEGRRITRCMEDISDLSFLVFSI